MKLLHRLQGQFPRYPPGLGLLGDAAGGDLDLAAAQRVPVAGRTTVTLLSPSSSSPLDLELLPLGVLPVIRLRF